MYTKTEQEPGNEARHGRGRQIHLFAINYSPIIWIIIKKFRSVVQQLTRFSSSTCYSQVALERYIVQHSSIVRETEPDGS